MNLNNDTYLQFAREHMGGNNPQAVEQFFYWNNPFALKHWTMNVVELLMIGGALFGLYHAIRVFKQQRNPANLCIWIASVLYFLMVEPALYFPQLFGLNLPIYFTHNEFSAGLMYDRAPLYIVMLYPALLYASYEFVRQAGIFERYGNWTSALCVGFVHSIFYEIFDQFGPQFAWWAWNYDEPTIHLRLASVPLSSIFLFSLLPPFMFSLLARVFLAKETTHAHPRSIAGWAWRTYIVAMLVPLGTMLPSLLFSGLVMIKATLAAQLLCFGTVLVFAMIALYVFSQTPPACEQAGATKTRLTDNYPQLFFVIYLVVFAGLWLYALDGIFSAINGITPQGNYVGSLPYAMGCFTACTYLVMRSFSLVARPHGRLNNLPT